MKKSFLLLFVALFLTVPLMAAEEPPTQLQLTMRSDKRVYLKEEPIWVTYTVTNYSKADVTIAKVSVSDEMVFAKEGAAEPLVLSAEGYIPEQESGYVTLKPGESIDRKGNLKTIDAFGDGIGKWEFQITETYDYARTLFPTAFSGKLISNILTIIITEEIK